MCKVFKLKTKTGLVTTTTDQSIVNCLIDNYDDELTITISKETISKERKEQASSSEINCFDLPKYTGINKLRYIKSLMEILKIDLPEAKRIADCGDIMYVENLDSSNKLELMLQEHEMSYVKTICESYED